MGHRGASSLPRRLIRHATRSAPRPPHTIRTDLIDYFVNNGVLTADKPLYPRTKRLHWNVDFILDLPIVSIAAAYVLHANIPLESQLAAILETDPHTAAFAPGLGANDARGQTHLLRVDGDERWWNHLPQRLDEMLRSMKSTRREGP
jgi:hypothetical protein